MLQKNEQNFGLSRQCSSDFDKKNVPQKFGRPKKNKNCHGQTAREKVWSKLTDLTTR